MIYVVLIQDGASVLTEYTKSYRGNRTQQASVPRTKFCYIAHEYKYGDYMLVNRAMRLEFLDAMGCRDCRVVFHQPMHTLQARSDLNFKLFIPYSAVNIHTIKMKIGNERECFTWRGQNWATILYKLFEWTENPLCRIQNVEIDRQMEGSQDIRAYSFPTNKLVSVPNTKECTLVNLHYRQFKY